MGPSMISSLEVENATYLQELPSLLAHEGRFVLIAKDRVLGTFDAYADAIQAGYNNAGAAPFLVKKIATIEESANFSRIFQACLA